LTIRSPILGRVTPGGLFAVSLGWSLTSPSSIASADARFAGSGQRLRAACRCRESGPRRLWPSARFLVYSYARFGWLREPLVDASPCGTARSLGLLSGRGRAAPWCSGGRTRLLWYSFGVLGFRRSRAPPPPLFSDPARARGAIASAVLADGWRGPVPCCEGHCQLSRYPWGTSWVSRRRGPRGAPAACSCSATASAGSPAT